MNLTEKIPESVQNHTSLIEYLETCSEIFEELRGVIKEHDWYKDYRNVPLKRLSLLSYRFNFKESPLLTEEITRGIIRDITTIYTTNGTRNALYWVFRLLGWKVKVENAWLLNPDTYFDGLITDSPEYPDGEGVYLKFRSDEEITSDSILDFISFGQGYAVEKKNQEYHNNAMYTSSEHLRIGEHNNFLGDIAKKRPTYKVEKKDQTYIPDTSKRMSGFPLIGLNFVNPISDNQRDDLSNLRERSFDYNKLDHRNFVYGKAVDEDDGTYFYGRTFDSIEENKQKLRIIREQYDVEDEWHSKEWVMSTPYIAITLTEEDYSKFVREYEYDGTVYKFKEKEEKTLIEYLINYVFYELIRPSPVKILVLGETVNLADDFKVTEDEYSDTWTAEPYPEEYDETLIVRDLSYVQTKVNLQPPSISVSPQCSPTAINVSFTADSDAQGVRVYRDTTPAGDWSSKPIVYEENTTSGTFQDTSISPDEGYWYMVEVFFQDIDVDSEIKGSLADCVYTPPSISISQKCSPTPSVTVNFNDSTGNSLGTRIYRNTSDAGWGTLTPIHTTSSSSGTYTDDNVSNGNTYYYRTESDFGGDDLQSSTMSVDIDCTQDPEVNASFTCYPTTVNVMYEVDSNDFDDVTLFSSESSTGPWTEVYTSTTQLSGVYSDDTVDSGKAYYYKIECTRSSDSSTYSEVVSTTPDCEANSISHYIQFTKSPSDYTVETQDQISHENSDYSRGDTAHVLIGENRFYRIQP